LIFNYNFKLLTFIPHENNNHSWRTFVFIFFVVLISGSIAYYITARSKATQNNLKTEIVQADKDVNNISIEKNSKDNSVFNPESDIIPVVKAEEVKVQEAIVEEPKPKSEILPQIERNKNPATRLEEARLYAKPQIMSGKYIDISLKFQNMVTFEDGKVLDAYQISSGKRGMETPTGSFRIENKTPRAWSSAYGLWMPNWMAIVPTGKIGIHELPIWPGGYQEGANHLGTPVSHGCIRLGKGSAKIVYDWADIGTPVIVHQ